MATITLSKPNANANSLQFYASAGLLVLLMSSFALSVMSTGHCACPLANPNFGTSYGVDGAIQDSDANMLYDFGSTGPKSGEECSRACQQWPNPGGILCRPKNNEQGQCAYWAWTAGGSE
jgi:hypothetical protein